MKRKKQRPALLFNPAFSYTPVAKQSEGYLRDKFAAIRAEMARAATAEQGERDAKVRKLGGSSK